MEDSGQEGRAVLEELWASHVVKELPGRNDGCVLACEPETQCVVKLKCDPATYMREYLASAVVSALGLRTPKVYKVRIEEAFVEQIDRRFYPKQWVGGMQHVGRHCFGSEYEPGLVPHGAAIPDGLSDEAARVLLVDLLIQNPDRRRVNVNIALRGGQFVLYDHDLAFSFLEAIGGAAPETDTLDAVADDHVFAELLEGDDGALGRAADWIEDRVQQLDADLWASLIREAPEYWKSGQENRIVDVMNGRVEKLASWLGRYRNG